MALCAPRKGLREKDKVWLLREQKRKKKLRKLLRRLQNNDTCSMPGLTCFTHDNRHWQTAPLWTREPAARAGGRTRGCIRGHPAGWGGHTHSPPHPGPGLQGWRALHPARTPFLRSGALLRLHQRQQQHVLVHEDHQRDPQLPLLRIRHRLPGVL